MFGLGNEIVPNSSSKYITNILYLYLLIFAFVAIAKAFCLDFGQVFTDLMAGMVLLLGASSYNHWMTSSFVFMTLIAVTEYFAKLGLNIQRSTPFFANDKRTFTNIAMIAGLVVYGIGWYLTFLAYKEYKAMAYGLPDLGAGEHRRLRSDSDAEEQKPLSRDYGTNQGPFAAFQGQGVRIGEA